MAARRQDLTESLLDRFKDALRTGTAKNLRKDARNWFRTKIQQGKKLARATYNRAKAGAKAGMTGMKPKDILRDGGYQRARFTGRRIVYGKMFFFEYDAKYKATLPYWDRYPLTIFFDYSPPHLMGLNLHYLPPYHRATLLDNLRRFQQGKELNSDTFLRIDWKKISNIKEVKPAVKKYLINRVGLAVQIPADEWDVAIFLPVARFVGASEGQVFKDSKSAMSRK